MQKVKLRSLLKRNANFKLRDDLVPSLRQLIDDLPSSEKNDYLKAEVFSKFVSKDTDPANVRKQRAINKWLATEMTNEATNERLMSMDPGFQILPRVTYESFISHVSHLIRRIIGEVVPDEVLLGVFSSGASTSRSRTKSHASGKYIGKAHVTKRALGYASYLIDEPTFRWWAPEGANLWSTFRDISSYEINDCNKLFTVPKKTDIDRCACKEPDINMYLQKGVGAYIRECLRRERIDLNDQTRNQSLARIGSRDGSLATVDLSSASDSVCTEFVFQALPVLWFTYLDDIRCHRTLLPDGTIHVNEMFSSMGNGFTFELESLLFYAIARSVAYFTGTSGTISIYGDDIIIPTSMYHDLEFVLGVLGFTVNPDKSHYETEFRESCGGHFVSGRCVTPFYIRGPVEDLHSLIVTANAVRKWARFDYSGPSCLDSILDDDAYPIWKLLTDRIPKCFWGGYDLEDNTRLVSSWKPGKPKRLIPKSSRRDTGAGGYLFWHNLKEISPSMPPSVTSILSVFTGRFDVAIVSGEDRWAAHSFGLENPPE